MTIQLAAVAFDVARGDPRSYTLPLRSGGAAVGVPEWSPSSTRSSPVAYVLDRLPEQVSVLARFRSDLPPGTTVVLGAAATGVGDPSGLPTPSLGPKTVTFWGGESGWCTFSFPSRVLLEAGVGTGEWFWTWQAQLHPFDPWTPIAQSRHTAFVTLSRPSAPWSVDPLAAGFDALPSVEALEVACSWARGTRAVDEAAARITAVLNALGPSTFTYDVLSGAPHYCVFGLPIFLIDAFIDRLRGRESFGPLLNCSDCATVVSTFANLLGADLWQSTMGMVGAGFPINPLHAIGSEQWSRLAGSFVFHEVAWSGAAGSGDRVFDACVHTDADADPTREPHVASLPINQVFGVAGSGGYRDQIAPPSGRALCTPQPSRRVRRTIVRSVAPRLMPLEGTIRAGVAARASLSSAAEPVAASPYFFDGFGWFGQELPGWTLTHAEDTAGPSEQAPVEEVDEGASVRTGTRLITSWWRPSASTNRLRIESFETPSLETAKELLFRVVSDVQSPLLRPLGSDGPGDATYGVPSGALVVFVPQANHVHVVRGVSRQPMPVHNEATRLDRWLVTAGREIGEWQVGASTRMGVGTATVGWRRLELRAAGARRAGSDLVVVPQTAGATIREVIVTPDDVRRANDRLDLA